jgi:hypothetical protein
MNKYKKAGFKLLLNHIKKKYPFVTGLKPNLEAFERYGTFIPIDIEFDLVKFYKSGAPFPKNYIVYKSLWELLEQEAYYLMRYTDESAKENYSSDYNSEFTKYMNSFYSHLPDYMRYSIFEGYSDDQLEKETSMSLESAKRWQNEKEPVRTEISYWKAKVDFDKLKEMVESIY